MTKSHVILSLATLMASLVGGLVGAYLPSYLDQLNWNKRFQLEQRHTVIKTRVSLLEKTVDLINQAPIIRGLRGGLDMDKQLVLLRAKCSSAKKSLKDECDSLPKISTSEIESSGERIYSLNAKFASALMLDSIYFGPQTIHAVQKIQKASGKNGLWSAPEVDKQKLVHAMRRELTWFPK